MSARLTSEEFRLVAKEWVEADAAARLLEETKTAVLSRMMADQGDMPVSRAELNVKASTEWASFIEEMVGARTRSNLLKVKLEWVRMKFSEKQSAEATARHEMSLSR